MSIRILLLEDNDADHDILSRRLYSFRPPPPTLTRVSDLNSARALLAVSDYDVVLLDLGMPGESPEGVLEKVLQLSGDAAIVVLSGQGSYDLLQLSLEGNVDGALTKNDLLGAQELESYILQAVHRKRESVRRDREHIELQVAHKALREELQSLREELARLQGREEGQDRVIKVTRGGLVAFTAAIVALSTLAGALTSLL